MVITPLLASNNNLAMANLDQNHPREPGQRTQDGITNQPQFPQGETLAPQHRYAH